MNSQYLIHTAESLIHAVSQIPVGRQHVLPLPLFGEWTVARIVFHQVWFESKLIAPYLSNWIDDDADQPDFSAFADDQEEQDWKTADHSMDALIVRFETYQTMFLDAYETLPAATWAQVKETVFGAVSLNWLMAKVYQTRLSQIDRLLEMALHWDLHLLALNEERQRQGREKDNQ